MSKANTFYHVYLENITVLEPQAGKRKMNLVPHLQQIPKKWPGCGARRRGVFFAVHMGVVVVALSSPEGHQDESQKTQDNCDTGHRGTGVFLDCQSPKIQFHPCRRS